jgi:hypothetical protein
MSGRPGWPHNLPNPTKVRTNSASSGRIESAMPNLPISKSAGKPEKPYPGFRFFGTPPVMGDRWSRQGAVGGWPRFSEPVVECRFVFVAERRKIRSFMLARVRLPGKRGAWPRAPTLPDVSPTGTTSILADAGRCVAGGARLAGCGSLDARGMPGQNQFSTSGLKKPAGGDSHVPIAQHLGIAAREGVR